MANSTKRHKAESEPAHTILILNVRRWFPPKAETLESSTFPGHAVADQKTALPHPKATRGRKVEENRGESGGK